MISFEVWRGVDLLAELGLLINLLPLYFQRKGDGIFYNERKYNDIPYTSIKRNKICAVIMLFLSFCGIWFCLFETIDVLNLEYEIVQGTVCYIGNTKRNNSKGPVSVITAEGKKEKVEYVHYDLRNLHIGDEVEIIKIIRGSSENLVMKRNGEYTVFYQRFAIGKDGWDRRIRGFLTRYLVCSSIFFVVLAGLIIKKNKQENICFVNCRRRDRCLQIWGLLSVTYKAVLAYLTFGECDMDVVKWAMVAIYGVEKFAFILSIAERYHFLEVYGMEVVVKDTGKVEKIYSRQDCELKKLGRGRYYKLSLAGETVGIVSGKNMSVQSLLNGTDIYKKRCIQTPSSITIQELASVREKNVPEYLEEKAAVFRKFMWKVVFLLTALPVMCLPVLLEVLDSPMLLEVLDFPIRLVIVFAYVAFFGSAILTGAYIKRSRTKRIRNKKISRVCEGEGIVLSQRPLAVKYRDTDGMLKVAEYIKENEEEKCGIGEKIYITLEDGKLASCRGMDAD